MITFTYSADMPLSPGPRPLIVWDSLKTVQRKVRRWAMRRRYEIIWSVQYDRVVIDIDAPTNREHNRACNSLSRILNRHIKATLQD